MTVAVVGGGVPADVFEVAAWLEELGEGPAKAVSADMVEWMCSSWSSGTSDADPDHNALFRLMAKVYNLETLCNEAGRDELVVLVPLARFPAIRTLIDLIGVDVDASPWLDDDEADNDDEGDDEEVRLELVASILGRTVTDLSSDGELLDRLNLP